MPALTVLQADLMEAWKRGMGEAGLRGLSLGTAVCANLYRQAPTVYEGSLSARLCQGEPGRKEGIALENRLLLL